MVEPKTPHEVGLDLINRVDALEKRIEEAETKAELHIHTSSTKLNKAQINEIVKQSMHQYGAKIGTEIRAQFGNI